METERLHGELPPRSNRVDLVRSDTSPSAAPPSTPQFLDLIGVPVLAPATAPFDPGYDVLTIESHLAQSAHLMADLKISMACWLIADEAQTRRKIAAACRAGVPTTAGGGPFEIATAQGRLPDYLDLCADIGFSRIECGEGFTTLPLAPAQIVRLARERGLEVQFELGHKHDGPMTSAGVEVLIEQGKAWLGAGANSLVIEARESGAGVGLFDAQGQLHETLADRFAEVFGLSAVVFEAPTKRSQFAFLSHFGPEVELANVRLEELLRVEIYRRGLHSDAFGQERLRPRRAPGAADPD